MQVLVGGKGMQTSLVKTGRPTGIEDWSPGFEGGRLLTPVPDGGDISSWFCAAFFYGITSASITLESSIESPQAH